MRNYDEFVARLRREIDEARLDGAAPRLDRLDGEPRREPARRTTWLLAAAALLVAAGVGGYAAYDAYAGRRILREDNRQFVDALFDRGLLEIATASMPDFDALFEGAPPPVSDAD